MRCIRMIRSLLFITCAPLCIVIPFSLAHGAAVKALGYGKVYNPDPLTKMNVPYGGQYVDNNNATNPALDNAREIVPLKDITLENGLYRLDGPYCVMFNTTDKGGTTDIFPQLPTNLFYFDRSQDAFEAVMSYYFVDKMARYLLSLGYWDYANGGLDRLQIDPHGTNLDGSFFNQDGNFIYLGDVNMDGGEDAGIIMHEYGHAIMHNIGPGIPHEGPQEEAYSISEGTSDYWDGSYTASVSPSNWQWHADWAMALSPYQRQFYPSFTYPDYTQNLPGQMIWVGALMKIWWALGKETTDRLVLQSIYDYTEIPSLAKAAIKMIRSDFTLYKGQHRATIATTFDQAGILQYIPQIPFTVIDSNCSQVPPTFPYPSMRSFRYDDWDVPGANDGPDNEHYLYLTTAAKLNISTCSPNTKFNTKLAVYQLTPTGPVLEASNDDGFCGADPTQAVIASVSLPAGQHIIVVDGNYPDPTDVSSYGDYELSVTYDRSLSVSIADNSFSNTAYVKPSLSITNTGTTSVSNFTIGYYFTVASGKTPVLEDLSTPNCTPALENLGNGNYRVKLSFTGVTLAAGQRLPASGTIYFGLRYSDNTFWNKADDYSQPGASPAVSDKVPVFNSTNELIYGTAPELPPAQFVNLKTYVLDEGFSDAGTTKPRFYIENSGNAAISNFVARYYFTVENGNTPIVDDYYTPNCTVTLQQVEYRLWCAVLNFSGYTLPAGGRVPSSDGQIFGLHYDNAHWADWNKSNDFSQPAGSTYAPTDRIAVFNSANVLVYGRKL